MNIIKQLIDSDGNNIYPIAYAQGGVRMDLLWTNPSPTSNFSAQTITVTNLSNYDAYMIFYVANASGAFYSSKIFSKNETSKSLILDMAENVTIYRKFVNNGDSTLTFETGYICTTYNTKTTDASRSMPIKIYGIKFSWIVPTTVQGLQYIEV